MANRKTRKQIWVHEDFHKLLKHKSIDEGSNILDLTEHAEDIIVNPLKKRK